MQDTQSAAVGAAKTPTLKQQMRRDKLFIASNATNPEAISRWFDKIDPNGEVGVQVFEKTLRRVTGINIKYQHA
jgi:hypothetical protein